jgi:hypothetical protein
MKRTSLGSDVLLWGLVAISVIATITFVALVAVYSTEYEILFVPIAAWFVCGLNGLLLALTGMALYFWRRIHVLRKSLGETGRELADLKKHPLEDEIPAIYGHQHLAEGEFLVLVQILFRRPPDIRYVHIRPLPGGYGGSTTLLAELQRKQGEALLPRSFVVKLGDRREMVDEYDKFHNYVLPALTRAPKFFRHAEWGDRAGIAYEFAGLDLDGEIQSLYQFYQGYAAVEVVELIGEIYTHLGRAWYQGRRPESVNLYDEYGLLKKKQELIIGQVGEIVTEDDSYRANFAAVEGRLRPNLRPNFCPPFDIPWYDPVAFLRTWPKHNLTTSIYRSVVHGDLHARNVLIEIAQNEKRLWFIDFSHTGNGLSGDRTQQALREGWPIQPDRGHTLRDFCRLEADVKFILTRLQDENDLKQAVLFEKELMASGLALSAPPPPVEVLTDERFRKAWQVIREIRRQAAAYLVNPGDLRPYYAGLLHATLPMVYYHRDQFETEACERQQKRYALISAGMVCGRL